MCDMGGCKAPATHYVLTSPAPRDLVAYRTCLCRKHLEMAHGLADANLTKITEYGRLDKAWKVHPGGKF